MANEDQLIKIRHSTAHVLAAVVKDVFPNAKLGIGPTIENGFYYDFDLPRPLTDDDLKILTKKMDRLIAAGVVFEKMSFPIPEAKKIFANQPYKLELIEDFEKAGEQEVSVYKSGDFVDLCKGPHVGNTQEIGAFKLTHQAGAYWRGSEKNKMLTRLYGTAFATPKELDQHLQLMEEAKKRDHRVLGKELDLFVFSDLVGKGLPLFTPKGAVIRRELEDFVQSLQEPLGYQRVLIPHLAKVALYEKSGHWAKYRENMFPVSSEEETQFALKPMNCPHHIELFRSRPRSYRELPQRYSEVTAVYRQEKAGELLGLVRGWMLTQDDAHNFCTEEQAVDEALGVYSIIKDFYAVFGFKVNMKVRLSLRDPVQPEKYLGNDLIWRKSEEMLRQVAKRAKLETYEGRGEAAFYAPKLDFMAYDSLGREWQLATIQLDLNFPERFDLKYIAKDGTEKRPVIIHRAILGSVERFMAILIEHFAGAFPVWLSPVQAVVIPISDKYLEYGNRVVEALKRSDLRKGRTLEPRVELDDRKETMSARIRDAELQKIPYMLVVGEREAASHSVNVRRRGGKEATTLTIAAFGQLITDKVQKRALDL